MVGPYHTVGTVTKLNIKIVESGNNDNTKIHDCSLSWLGRGTSIKRGGVKLVLQTQTSPLGKMTSKMPTLTYNWANREIYFQ